MKRIGSTSQSKMADRGQILVVFVLAVVAIIAMVGVVIDGGNVFAQQRIAQNGSDSAATAGALIVAERMSGKTRTQHDVYTAVDTAATANDLASYVADYTDDTGNPIGVAVTLGSRSAGSCTGCDRAGQP